MTSPSSNEKELPDADRQLLQEWLRLTAHLSAYAAGQKAGISDETVSRYRRGEVPSRLSSKVREAMRVMVREESVGVARPTARREVVANLLRAYRLQLWESAGQFALDVFEAAVDQQRAALGAAMAEVPPEIPAAEVGAFRQPTIEELRAASPPSAKKA